MWEVWLWAALCLLTAGPAYPAPPASARQLSERESTELAWLLIHEAPPRGLQAGAPLSLRRITPKSVFLTPTFTSCSEGYQQDAMGRCVKVVKLNQQAQWEFFLQKFNSMYAAPEPSKKESSGPLKLPIPIEEEAGESMTTEATTTTDPPPPVTTTQSPPVTTTQSPPVTTTPTPARSPVTTTSLLTETPFLIVVANTTDQMETSETTLYETTTPQGTEETGEFSTERRATESPVTSSGGSTIRADHETASGAVGGGTTLEGLETAPGGTTLGRRETSPSGTTLMTAPSGTTLMTSPSGTTLMTAPSDTTLMTAPSGTTLMTAPSGTTLPTAPVGIKASLMSAQDSESTFGRPASPSLTSRPAPGTLPLATSPNGGTTFGGVTQSGSGGDRETLSGGESPGDRWSGRPEETGESVVTESYVPFRSTVRFPDTRKRPSSYIRFPESYTVAPQQYWWPQSWERLEGQVAWPPSSYHSSHRAQYRHQWPPTTF